MTIWTRLNGERVCLLLHGAPDTERFIVSRVAADRYTPGDAVWLNLWPAPDNTGDWPTLTRTALEALAVAA
jgi:hypothetical protein